MSTKDTSGFGQFIPGFDFLKGLTQSAGGLPGMANMPNMSKWIAPSMSVEDLEKRIEELKHVQFWLEQNARALAATVQALEVQKMTMATLQGMNFNLADIASALTPRAATPSPAAQPFAAKSEPAPAPAAAAASARAQAASASPSGRRRSPKKGKPTAAGTAAGMVDPLQLWGALTQQFQKIAATAVKDVAAAAHQKDRAATAPAAPSAATSAATGTSATSPPAAAPSTATRVAATKTPRRATPRKRTAS